MIVIFVGPTLAGNLPEVPGAVYLPPASQGDVYRAAQKEPVAIGLIDGFFDRVPAVWHKEILWAMTQGIYVFGSASMGALRAAELDSFGMEGVGRIFEAYREGSLTDDDEVALVHGPADTGYREISEPMVNIRATLARAESERVLASHVRITLERVAKELYYPERQYSAILKLAVAAGISNSEIDSFRRWLPTGHVNQKRADAMEMIERMRQRFSMPVQPQAVNFSFEYTTLWIELTRYAGELTMSDKGDPKMVSSSYVIDELKSNPTLYAYHQRNAMARILAMEESRRHGLKVDEALLSDTIVNFRRELQLLDSEDMQRWLEANKLTQRDFLRLMEREARVRWVESAMELEIDQAVCDSLRVTNRFAELDSQARQSLQNNIGTYDTDLF